MKKFFVFFIICFKLSNSSAQAVGSRVSFAGADGKTYTGVITEINDDKYKIKYTDIDYETWFVKDRFTVLEENITAYKEQIKGLWQTGDKVSVRTGAMETWSDATIYLVLKDSLQVTYKVTLDNAPDPSQELLVTATQIKSRPAKPAASIPLFSRVDVYYANGEANSRGAVIEILQEGYYKVRLDGCNSKWDLIVDNNQVKPAALLSPQDNAVTDIVGNWMFVPASSAARSDAKWPPLQVNADGTYVWYYNPAVQGRWEPDSKMEGLAAGAAAFNGILIQDAEKNYYKVYISKSDQVIVSKLCTAVTETASRIK
ncbi:MAG: hypothetical protein QM791_04580 [Ferruginibacter sp.]